VWDETSAVATFQRHVGPPLDRGDDGWTFAEAGQTVLSVDQYADGVDFDLAFMTLGDVGYRALGGALSDLAAMGADARAFLVAVGVPPTMSEAALAELARGLGEQARSSGVAFAGGDLGRAATLVLTITAVGAIPSGERALRRSGARPGDRLFVTGRPGLAALGLRALREGRPVPEAVERFLRPAPRLAAGQALRRAGATACIDITDGLARELALVAELSGVGLRVWANRLPALPAAPEEALELALFGGDDYELLFAVPPSVAPRVAEALAPLPVREIGEVRTRDEGLRLVGPDGREGPLPEGGYQHRGG
jgi:thiamine-monophosphate kinase